MKKNAGLVIGKGGGGKSTQRLKIKITALSSTMQMMGFGVGLCQKFLDKLCFNSLLYNPPTPPPLGGTFEK